MTEKQEAREALEKLEAALDALPDEVEILTAGYGYNEGPAITLFKSFHLLMEMGLPWETVATCADVKSAMVEMEFHGVKVKEFAYPGTVTFSHVEREFPEVAEEVRKKCQSSSGT